MAGQAKHKDWLSILINNLRDEMFTNLKVAYVGKIAKLTPPTADIQPLAVIKGSKQNIVSKARFVTIPTEYKDSHEDTNGKGKLHYKTGDNVLVVVIDHDDMFFTNKDTYKVDSERKHAIDFSYVIGKIADKNDFA